MKASTRFRPKVNKKLLLKAHNTKLKVGILGGTFNPPHKGHIEISEAAINRLGLDYVVWLVAKQNPLKALKTNESFEDRIEKAKLLNTNPRIIISDYEAGSEERYTFKLLEQIKAYNHHKLKLYWIMGADNMVNFHQWKNWKHIYKLVPIIIVDRNHHIVHKISSRLNACLKFIPVLSYASKEGLNNKRVIFIKIRKNPISSTELRNKYEQSSNRTRQNLPSRRSGKK